MAQTDLFLLVLRVSSHIPLPTIHTYNSFIYYRLYIILSTDCRQTKSLSLSHMVRSCLLASQVSVINQTSCLFQLLVMSNGQLYDVRSS